jgi:hypothetical protein
MQGGAFETLCTHKHCHLSCINIDPICGLFCSQAVGELSRHQFLGHRVRHGAAGGAGAGAGAGAAAAALVAGRLFGMA